MTATTGTNDKIATRLRKLERSIRWAWLSMLLTSVTVGYVLLADGVAIGWRVLAVAAWVTMAVSVGLTMRAPRR